MDFTKRHLLLYLMRTPEVAQNFQMQKLVQKKLVREKYSSTGSMMWRFGVPMSAVGFGSIIAGSLAAKAQPPAATTGYVTIPKELVQEKDSSIGSMLWRVGVPLTAEWVAVSVSAAGCLGSIIAGSLAAKEKSLTDTTGVVTIPKEPEQEKDSSTGSMLGRVGVRLAVGAAVAGVVVPAVVAAAGFGAGGITTGSLAAKGMSLTDTTGVVTIPKEPEQEKDSSTDSMLWRVGVRLAVGAAVAGLVVVAVPAVVAAAGFGAGGITAGSLAAKGMSLAATTGHGMWVISSLQSVGATGVTAWKALMVWSTVTTGASMLMNGSGNEDKKEKEFNKP